MKPAASTRPSWWTRIVILLGFVLVTGACGPAPIHEPSPVVGLPTLTGASPTTTTTSPTVDRLPTSTPITVMPTEVPATLTSITKDIVANAGRVMAVVEAKPKEMIIDFEEFHNSRAGQIEIAIMLNRLYEKYGVRQIGLEGASSEEAFCKDGNLNTAWFSPSFKAGQPIGPREEVIVQELEDGEISSAEMMALVYGDARVACIEKKEEYDYEPPEKGAAAQIIYLYAIALPGMTESESRKHEDLIREGKLLEAVEYAISTDKFTVEAYARLSDRKDFLSVEQTIMLLDEIVAKATIVERYLPAENKEHFAAQKRFYQIASLRSQTMVTNTLSLTKRFPGAPVALLTGAGHTEGIKKLLNQAGVSFAVIRPKSLDEGPIESDLSAEAMDRKLEGLSVGAAESLGALLDARRKPRPGSGEAWFQSDAEIRLLTASIARAAARGEALPFDSTVKEVLPKLKSVTLVPNTIEMDANDVIFSFYALDNKSQRVQLWARARVDGTFVAKTLEIRLFEGLSNLKKRPPTAIRVSSDTIARFARDKALLNTPL